MIRFRQLFGQLRRPAIIGMVHVDALPGTPKHTATLDQIVEKACSEAAIYSRHQLDGVLVENMHDIPYTKPPSPPEIVSCMTRVCTEVRRTIGSVPLGVQLLAGANQEALAVAMASGAQFIRAEGFVYSHVADEGWMDGCAGPLLRYRKTLGAEHILVFTDIKKKHSSHAVTRDVSLIETAQAAEFFLSDGVILTGSATGQPADHTALEHLRKSTAVPLLIGSGVTDVNLKNFKVADAIVIGSHFKNSGVWHNKVNEDRISDLVQLCRALD